MTSSSAAETSNAKKSFIQLIKFALVGVVNTLVDVLVFTLLVFIFNVPKSGGALLTVLFNVIAYSCGILNSFLMNTHWTFKAEYKRTKRETIEFIALNLVSLGLSTLLIFIFKNYVFTGSSVTAWVCNLINYTNTEKMVTWLSKLLATPIVIIVNFLGSKLLVFNK